MTCEVWDNGGRLASNECMGGLSFSLEELAQFVSVDVDIVVWLACS